MDVAENRKAAEVKEYVQDGYPSYTITLTQETSKPRGQRKDRQIPITVLSVTSITSSMDLRFICDREGNATGLQQDFTVRTTRVGTSPSCRLFYTQDDSDPFCARLTKIVPEGSYFSTKMHQVEAMRFPDSDLYPKRVNWVQTVNRLRDSTNTLTAADLDTTLLVR